MATHFSPKAMVFLRGLKRNNDRNWFNDRKAIYEQELKAPMLALIEEINHGLAEFAPDHVRPPAKAMMRIYRDIRFSNDKRPYKSNIAAWWARSGLEKTSGGGFYFHISPKEVHISAGAYMPEREQLLAIRRHLLEHHEEMRAILRSIEGTKRPVTLKAAPMKQFDGLKLTRAPKGFPADHPALDLILHRQWGVTSELPVEAATSAKLVEEVVTRFRLAAPLVALLNAPLKGRTREPIF
jgi:uncharacterized protein (TIGR02453 family)